MYIYNMLYNLFTRHVLFCLYLLVCTQINQPWKWQLWKLQRMVEIKSDFQDSPHVFWIFAMGYPHCRECGMCIHYTCNVMFLETGIKKLVGLNLDDVPNWIMAGSITLQANYVPNHGQKYCPSLTGNWKLETMRNPIHVWFWIWLWACWE